MKETGKQPSLKEKAVHGTQAYPYACYQFDGQEDFPVPLHWHRRRRSFSWRKGNIRCGSRESGMPGRDRRCSL